MKIAKIRDMHTAITHYYKFTNKQWANQKKILDTLENGEYCDMEKLILNKIDISDAVEKENHLFIKGDSTLWRQIELKKNYKYVGQWDLYLYL